MAGSESVTMPSTAPPTSRSTAPSPLKPRNPNPNRSFAPADLTAVRSAHLPLELEEIAGVSFSDLLLFLYGRYFLLL